MTPRDPVRSFSAPGKLFLAGEYAVLENKPALVVAVERRVRIEMKQTSGVGSATDPEILAALHRSHTQLGVEASVHHLDRTALYDGVHKLGLGSSAANAAVATAGCYALAGHCLDDPSVVGAVLTSAIDAHRTVSPNGSGADVAASVHGGVISFQRSANDIRIEAVPWPAEYGLVALWSGTSIRTSELLQHVARFASSHPSGYRQVIEALAEASQGIAQGLQTKLFSSLQSSALAHVAGLRVLSAGIGIDLIGAETESALGLAHRHGGAAKPSGAGGGDCSVAIFPSQEAAEAFCVQISRNFSSMRPLRLSIASNGIREEP